MFCYFRLLRETGEGFEKILDECLAIKSTKRWTKYENWEICIADYAIHEQDDDDNEKESKDDSLEESVLFFFISPFLPLHLSLHSCNFLYFVLLFL